MEVLWPRKDAVAPAELTTEDINNGSMVVRFDFKEHSSLFTGDLYVKGEADLIADAAEGKLDVDLLKIPHHGYTSSSSLEFIKAVSPELAIAMGISATRKEIESRFESNEVIYCHDCDDQYIHAVTDGKTMEYDTAWTRAREQKK
jgi:competence protein ComEC